MASVLSNFQILAKISKATKAGSCARDNFQKMRLDREKKVVDGTLMAI